MGLELIEKFEEKAREKRLEKEKRWKEERKQDYLKKKAKGEEIKLTSAEKKEVSDKVLEEEELQDKISLVTNNVIYFRKPWLRSSFKNFGSLVSTLEDTALRAYVKAKTGRDFDELSADEVEEEVDLEEEISFDYDPFIVQFITRVRTDSTGETTIEVNNGDPNLVGVNWYKGSIGYTGEKPKGPAREVFDGLYETLERNLRV